MPYVAVNGVDHYYEWISTEPPGSQGQRKPVMVFVHGWAGSARYWRSTAIAQQDQFDCLLYDMRGFGRSPLSAIARAQVLQRGYELDTFADDLAGLLDCPRPRAGLPQRPFDGRYGGRFLFESLPGASQESNFDLQRHL